MSCRHYTRGELGEDYNSADYEYHCVCCSRGFDKDEDCSGQCAACAEWYCGICAQDVLDMPGCCENICEACREHGTMCPQCESPGCRGCLKTTCASCISHERTAMEMLCEDCAVPCWKCKKPFCSEHAFPIDCWDCGCARHICRLCEYTSVVQKLKLEEQKSKAQANKRSKPTSKANKSKPTGKANKGSGPASKKRALVK